MELEALRSVGAEGKGHREAALAWLEVAQSEVSALPRILSAMDGANPLAVNWIRAAVDAIAEGELRRGGNLPGAQLEEFILELRHDPRARRLAYEWLCRQDPSSPDRILPRLGEDPSVEIRRDIAARRLASAQKAAREGRSAEAVQEYREALRAARDKDQIREAASKLKELGESVDLAKHFGFLRDWKVIGPFDNPDSKAFDVAYPPESSLDLAAEHEGKGGKVRWKDFSTEDDYGMVDLNKVLGKHKNSIAYAVAEFHSDGDRTVEIRLGCVTGWKLWLNGKFLFGHEEYHHGMEIDQFRVSGELRQGRNLILLKVVQNDQTEDFAQLWQFQLRICDGAGTAVPPQRRAAVLEWHDRLERPASACCTSLPLGSSSAPGSDWLQFRGPGGSGTAGGENVPVSLKDKDGFAWKADLPGRGVSSPIVLSGRVIVTASSGYRQDKLHVLCLDAKDGRKLWERQFWATGRTMCHPKTCMAAPTPASDGQRILAFYSTNDLFCLDLEGRLLWLRGLTWDYPNASNSMGMASSPLVSGPVAVVQVENQSDSFAAGVDVGTGENLWKVRRSSKPSWSTPVLLEGSAGASSLLLQSWDSLSGHDLATGRQLWVHDGETNCIPSCSVHGGLVFLPAEGVTALRPGAGGAPPEVVWRSSKLRPGMSSPLIHGGKLYALSGNGILACAEPVTGEVSWQVRLKGTFSSSPVAAGEHVYCASEDGILHDVRIGGQPEVVGTCELGETILATPAISGRALFLRSDAHLWKIGER
jgi:outer membrane protein assembly factor BamB